MVASSNCVNVAKLLLENSAQLTEFAMSRAVIAGCGQVIQFSMNGKTRRSKIINEQTAFEMTAATLIQSQEKRPYSLFVNVSKTVFPQTFATIAAILLYTQ